MSKLSDWAIARSGDKGNHANIGVIASDAASYAFLLKSLTSDKVLRFFSHLGPSRVERFEMPNVQAFNFVLYDILAGGASRSLRTDTQGKLLGSMILNLELPEND